MRSLVIKIPYDCGQSVEGATRASAGAREGIPPTRRQCCARYKFPLEIAMRRRFSLGRPRIAKTLHPDWRQYSGKFSTLFYPPARECDDVLVCSAPARRRLPYLSCYLRFGANNNPLEGEGGHFSLRANRKRYVISPGDGIYASRPPRTSHTRRMSAITSGSSREPFDLLFCAATNPKMRVLLRRDAFGGKRNLKLRGDATRIPPCAPKNLKEPPDEPGLRASGPVPRKGGCGIGRERRTTDPKRTTSLEAKRKLDCTFRRPEVGEYPWLGTLGRFSAQLGAMNVTDIR